MCVVTYFNMSATIYNIPTNYSKFLNPILKYYKGLSSIYK